MLVVSSAFEPGHFPRKDVLDTFQGPNQVIFSGLACKVIVIEYGFRAMKTPIESLNVPTNDTFPSLQLTLIDWCRGPGKLRPQF